jgi:hypothetical protein
MGFELSLVQYYKNACLMRVCVCPLLSQIESSHKLTSPRNAHSRLFLGVFIHLDLIKSKTLVGLETLFGIQTFLTLTTLPNL